MSKSLNIFVTENREIQYKNTLEIVKLILNSLAMQRAFHKNQKFTEDYKLIQSGINENLKPEMFNIGLNKKYILAQNEYIMFNYYEEAAYSEEEMLLKYTVSTVIFSAVSKKLYLLKEKHVGSMVMYSISSYSESRKHVYDDEKEINSEHLKEKMVDGLIDDGSFGFSSVAVSEKSDIEEEVKKIVLMLS